MTAVCVPAAEVRRDYGLPAPRVWGWQTDGAACTYYRLHLPLTELAAHGWRTAYGYGLPPNLHEPGAHPDWDVVIASRLAQPSDVHHWTDLCQRPGGPLCVYDLDDNLLNVDPNNHGPYELYEPLRPHVVQALAVAHRVTVSTPGLARVVAVHNPNVTVVPNCLHPSIFDLPRPRQPHAVTVGWGGSMFHGQDWPGIATQLSNLVTARYPDSDVDFHTVGADYMTGLPHRATGWTDHHTYHRALDFHIGIAPVAETPFNACKSWLKVLEYAGRGIVPVATAWGQYPEFITHGENGYLVINPDDWQTWLLTLIDNPPLREQMTAAAEDEARNWTIDRRLHLWRDALTR